ncbi:MAG TPA: hypothetical protein VGI66_13635, partial [Streptosporangiaceae bacterium]
GENCRDLNRRSGAVWGTFAEVRETPALDPANRSAHPMSNGGSPAVLAFTLTSGSYLGFLLVQAAQSQDLHTGDSGSRARSPCRAA